MHSGEALGNPEVRGSDRFHSYAKCRNLLSGNFVVRKLLYKSRSLFQLFDSRP